MIHRGLFSWRIAAIAAGMITTQAAAQTSSSVTPSYIVPGYFNLRTGAFIPRQAAASAASDRATHNGTFDVTVTINIVSSVPTSQAVTCLADVDASDASADNYDEQASAIAVRSGSTATCTLSIPYSWVLGSTPTYTTSFSITTSAAAGVPLRASSQFKFGSTAVPANGKTTKIAVAVTL